jgi:hypothetical protein
MNKFWTLTTVLTLAMAASAQTSASGQSSTNANAGVAASQQGAAGASTDANANPQGAATSSATAGTGISSNSNLASGTTILAALTKSVDAKKAKQGDEVTARAAQNVVSNGSVVIPRGTKLIGHVTDAKAREKGQNESSVAIAFDKAVLKNGEEVPLQASIRAISAAPNNNAANSPMPDMGGAGVDTAGPGNGGMNGDMGPRNGGAMGGPPPSSTGSTGGPVGSPAGNMGGASGNTTKSAGQIPGAANGELNPGSQGVIGLQGLTLNSQAGSASVISSNTKNVKLDNGTQLLLQVVR